MSAALPLRAQEAGPPAPADPGLVLLQVRLAETERVLHGTLSDGLLIAGSGGVDLYATGHCASSNPTCFSDEPMQNDRRGLQVIAVKTATVPLGLGACYWLRRKGHHGWARALAVTLSVAHAALAVRSFDKAGKR